MNGDRAAQYWRRAIGWVEQLPPRPVPGEHLCPRCGLLPAVCMFRTAQRGLPALAPLCLPCAKELGSGRRYEE